jgi:ankyrin repeat protein
MAEDSALRGLLKAIASADDTTAFGLLDASPALARAALKTGATRATASDHYLGEIGHYAYSGDTALHIAAAAYRPDLLLRLLNLGADVSARNRRGAQALHYAADGQPRSPRWNPLAQAETVACLIAAGADPNAIDRGGVTPLHRAVRTRCAAAVNALLQGGADARLPNMHGSTPMKLATRPTGRGGSGSPEARRQQAEIVRLLERAIP